MPRLEVSGAVRPIWVIRRQRVNYGINISSISTLMCAMWHVDKYKITFKLIINHWTNEIL